MRVIVKIDHVYQSQEVAKQIKYYSRRILLHLKVR